MVEVLIGAVTLVVAALVVGVVARCALRPFLHSKEADDAADGP